MSTYRQRDIVLVVFPFSDASLEQSIIIKQIARLKLPVFRHVVAEIEDLIKSP